MPAQHSPISAFALLPAAPGNLANVRRALAATAWNCAESADPAGTLAHLAIALRERDQQLAAGKPTSASTQFKLIIVDPASAHYLPALADALAHYFPAVELWLLDSASSALRPANPQPTRPPIAHDPRPSSVSRLVDEERKTGGRGGPPRRPAKPVLRLAEVDDEDLDDLQNVMEHPAPAGQSPSRADSPAASSDPCSPTTEEQDEDDDAPPLDSRRLTREEIQMLLDREPPESTS